MQKSKSLYGFLGFSITPGSAQKVYRLMSCQNNRTQKYSVKGRVVYGKGLLWVYDRYLIPTDLPKGRCTVQLERGDPVHIMHMDF